MPTRFWKNAISVPFARSSPRKAKKAFTIYFDESGVTLVPQLLAGKFDEHILQRRSREMIIAELETALVNPFDQFDQSTCWPF